MTRVLNWIGAAFKTLASWLFAEPSYLFDETSYQNVFGFPNEECIHSFDCNAGDHSDACPCSK